MLEAQVRYKQGFPPQAALHREGVQPVLTNWPCQPHTDQELNQDLMNWIKMPFIQNCLLDNHNQIFGNDILYELKYISQKSTGLAQANWHLNRWFDLILFLNLNKTELLFHILLQLRGFEGMKLVLTVHAKSSKNVDLT